MIGVRKADGRRSYLAPAAIVVLLAGALAAFGLSFIGLSKTHAADAPPTTPASTASPPASKGLTRSPAVQLSIPAIGVLADLQHLGLNGDAHTMQLPGPNRAGWYARGAAPGEVGPTIIVGYIASPHGPGVFVHLNALEMGAHIAVRRADGTEVVYGVDRIEAYAAAAFPADKVYAPTAQPTLRLITCGGILHPGAPAGNVVVFGHQLAVRT